MESMEFSARGHYNKEDKEKERAELKNSSGPEDAGTISRRGAAGNGSRRRHTEGSCGT